MSVKLPNYIEFDPNVSIRGQISQDFQNSFQLPFRQTLLVQVLKPVIKINDYFVQLSIENLLQFNPSTSLYEMQTAHLKMRFYKIIDGSKVEEKITYASLESIDLIPAILQETFRLNKSS